MYCTLEDIKKHLPEERIVELSDDLNPGRGGSVNEEIVDEIINESSVLIDSIISGRYSLPFSDAPPLLNKICIDLSIYNLSERRQWLDDSMNRRYDNAMKLLKMIAEGDILLGAPMPAESPGFFAGSMVEGGPAQFTMNTMRSL